MLAGKSRLRPGNTTEEQIEELLAQKDGLLLTPEERRAQRVSYVMGMLGHESTMTREEVQAILNEHYV